MKFKLPKIYPITDTRIAKLSHTEQVKRFIEGGAEFIQLREKYASPKIFYEDALEAIKIARAENVKIIINDRVDIAIAVKADGVHLGQDDFPPVAARKILGENAVIGYSTHNFEQISEAIGFPVDYVAFGPVFATTTKKNPDKTVGLEKLKQVREIIGSFPLVAIGGINLENFLKVLTSGANSVAIISDLISYTHFIPEKYKEFIEKLQNK